MLETLRVPQRTGTHADVLLAVGIADLLADIFPASQVRLRDDGGVFHVAAPAPPLDRIPRDLPCRPGYPVIVEKGAKAPAGAEVCDYDHERERARRYHEQRQALREQKRPATEIDELLKNDRPSPGWRRVQAVRSLQGHLTGNKLATQILELDETKFRQHVADGLDRLLRHGSSGLKWKAELVQVFNPPAAKGYARLKPNSTGRNDSTRDAWGDPLAEWLRIRGFHRIATPYFPGSKREHVRILTPIPKDLSLAALRAVADELQRVPIGGGEPKLDALAVLHLTTLLIQHSEEHQKSRPTTGRPAFLRFSGRTPSRVIQGIHVTHYQSLGQSRAVGTMQRLGLPNWFGVHTPQDAGDWLEILGEHIAIVRMLDDQKSDEIGLLLAYRRIFQTAEEETATAVAEAFLDFLGQYGCFVIRAREQKRRVRQFLTHHIRRVLMGMDESYAELLENPGFQAIAGAVRKATVNAQFQKVLKVPKHREIRYDLLPELRRKRSLADDEFMEVISEFISQYNAENARRREMGLKAPRNITVEEFHAFAFLVDRHRARKIGSLLCAYATCRDPQDQDTPNDPSSESTAAEEAAAGDPSADEGLDS